MKKLKITSLLLIILFGFVSIIPAKTTNTSKFFKKSKIESNLLAGLASDNTGLQISSAYFLGEINSEKAIIPLMRMLRSGKSNGERAMAALALIKIGDERGVFIVKREAQFNASQKTRKLCAHLYKSYLMENFYKHVNSRSNLAITKISN